LETEIASSKRVSLWLAFGLLTLCSCRQTDPRGDHHGQRGFAALEGVTYKALHAENADLVSQRKLLEMEMQWLVLRKKLLLSEIDAMLAKESEISLAVQMARFAEMEELLPGEEGFIEEGQRRGWETRLRVRREETAKAATKARLLQRDMNDLLGKLARRGFEPPVRPNDLPRNSPDSVVEP
tara:strand:+ start:5408 stop:5953 length:546 start_codon:yes stop_codon:yes gene_type:complete